MGLGRVHACGVLHKDVHPRNFLRGARGRVVLTDFAFSELSDSESGRQRARADVQRLWVRASFGPNTPLVPRPMSNLLRF